MNCEFLLLNVHAGIDKEKIKETVALAESIIKKNKEDKKQA